MFFMFNVLCDCLLYFICMFKGVFECVYTCMCVYVCVLICFLWALLPEIKRLVDWLILCRHARTACSLGRSLLSHFDFTSRPIARFLLPVYRLLPFRIFLIRLYRQLSAPRPGIGWRQPLHSVFHYDGILCLGCL